MGEKNDNENPKISRTPIMFYIALKGIMFDYNGHRGFTGCFIHQKIIGLDHEYMIFNKLQVMNINPILNKILAFNVKMVGNIEVSGYVEQEKFEKILDWAKHHWVLLWKLKDGVVHA